MSFGGDLSFGGDCLAIVAWRGDGADPGGRGGSAVCGGVDGAPYLADAGLVLATFCASPVIVPEVGDGFVVDGSVLPDCTGTGGAFAGVVKTCCVAGAGGVALPYLGVPSVLLLRIILPNVPTIVVESSNSSSVSPASVRYTSLMVVRASFRLSSWACKQSHRKAQCSSATDSLSGADAGRSSPASLVASLKDPFATGR